MPSHDLSSSEITETGIGEALTILYQDDDLIAVDKPSGIPTHAPSLGRMGVVELLQKQLGGERLGIHQRLDAVTSGVLLFSRTPKGARSLAFQFENREVSKRYLALCAGILPLKPGEWRHHLVEGEKRQEAHPAEYENPGILAVTRYQCLKHMGMFSLVSLEPHTGRTHQLRVQLAAIGAPILGDELYGGGTGFGRVALHASRLELQTPDGTPLVISSPTPPFLDEGHVELESIIGNILANTSIPDGPPQDARQLFSGVALGIPGIHLQRYGDFGALHCFDSAWDDAALKTLGTSCAEWGELKGIELKMHGAHKGTPVQKQSKALIGEVPEGRFEVREHGARYLVDLHERYGSGLYLDQRDNRGWISRISKGVEVMNLFAYTCSFSVAAALGGSARVTSVDLSRRALSWGKENFTANGLDPSAHRFFADEVFKVLGRQQRRGELYGLVICDPPSFARKGKRTFSLHKELTRLTHECANITAPDGWLLMCLNHRKTSMRQFEGQVRSGIRQAGREIISLKHQRPDHTSAVGTDLKSLRIQLK